jgi:type II secretory pathway component PulK
MVAAAVLALAATLAGRAAFDATRNRIGTGRARWLAHDCAERAQATMDELLRAGDESEAAATWRMLGQAVQATPLAHTTGCNIALEAAGTRLDINSATEEQLRALFHVMGRLDAEALVDAVADWRDADDMPRSAGVESAWYTAARRSLPRNGPLADIRELQLVRGFEELSTFDSLLVTEPAPLALNSAPLTVLAAVPGFGPEILQRIAERRAAGRQIVDVLALAAGVSPRAASDVLGHFAEISRLTTAEPVAWLVTARGHDGEPVSTATIELRVVRAGRRAAVVRRRNW